MKEVRHKVKVWVTTFEYEKEDNKFIGEVYLKYNERLQDLLNDEREFIPFEIEALNRPYSSTPQEKRLRIVSKRAIKMLEKVDQD